MTEERRDKLTPNSKRSLDEEGRNPADLRRVATELLSGVAYATTLVSPTTARALAALPSDAEISVDDEAAGETMFANAAVQTVNTRDSFIAPLVKLVARRRNSRLHANYEHRSQRAGRKRLQHIAKLQGEGRNYLTWRTTRVAWPEHDGTPLSPLEIYLAEREHVVALTSYEIKASGYIELVRACGKVIGPCDGDWLADQFMRMVIALSGLHARGADRAWGAELVNGGFLKMVERTDTCDWTPLSGQDQHLAMTVLAAWLRMSRLGVDLLSAERLESWRLFFDGTIYGADPALCGEIWSKQRRRKDLYDLAEQWKGQREHPWLVDSSGSPVIVIGIAAEILRMAISAVQEVGFVPDGMDSPVDDTDPVYEMSDKVLTQLKRHYRDLAGSSVGSVTGALLTLE